MAYNALYVIYFKDDEQELCRIEISKENALPIGGVAAELEATEDPCTISWSGSDDKKNGVTGSEMQFSFFNEGIDLSSLFVVGDFEVKVTLDRTNGVNGYRPVWHGFLNTENFTEDYSTDYGTVSLVANDGLAAIEYENLIADDVVDILTLGTEKITTIVANAVSSIGVLAIHTNIDITGENSDFYELSVDLANFMDEDKVSLSKREALNWICDTFSLNAYIFSDILWLTDSNLMSNPLGCTYGVYTPSFVSAPVPDITILPLNLSGVDSGIEFDGLQSIDTLSGRKDITVNYAPYATVDKISRATGLDDYEIVDKYYAWQVPAIPMRGYYNNEYEFAYSRPVVPTADAKNELGLGDPSHAAIKNMFTSRFSDAPAALDSSGRLVGISVVSTKPLEEEEPDLTPYGHHSGWLTGGWIPKTDDVIDIEFDLEAAFDYFGNPDQVGVTWDGTPTQNLNSLSFDKARLALYFKVDTLTGSVYGDGGYNAADDPDNTCEKNEIAMDSEYQNVVYLDAGDPTKNNSHQLSTKLRFTMNGNSEAGIFKFQMINSLKVGYFNAGSGEFHDVMYEIPYAWYCGLRNPRITINGFEFNNEDAEIDGTTRIEFKKDETVELNISSKRDQGSLDRGCLVNALGEHESTFYRKSTLYHSSLAGALIQGYLGQYRHSYKQLNANIRVPAILIEGSSTFNGVISPITPIRDEYSGSEKVPISMMTNGVFNVRSLMVNGSWSECFSANLTI